MTQDARAAQTSDANPSPEDTTNTVRVEIENTLDRETGTHGVHLEITGLSSQGVAHTLAMLLGKFVKYLHEDPTQAVEKAVAKMAPNQSAH